MENQKLIMNQVCFQKMEKRWLFPKLKNKNSREILYLLTERAKRAKFPTQRDREFYLSSDLCMSVSSVYRSQFSSDFDETWHTYSLILNLDFVDSFFDMGENKGECLL